MIEGLEGLFNKSNGPAYQKHEQRVGPPLAYVQEKSGNSLLALHEALRVLRDEQLASGGASGQPSARGGETVLNSVRGAFYYGLVAHLALINMLALANENGLVDRLTGYSATDFEEWLRAIEAGGSVTGC